MKGVEVESTLALAILCPWPLCVFSIALFTEVDTSSKNFRPCSAIPRVFDSHYTYPTIEHQSFTVYFRLAKSLRHTLSGALKEESHDEDL